jgi:heat shock protein HtpX
MVETLAQKANIPMPRVGISPTHIPNAFAFGRGARDGRVCVTQGILNLLNEDELKAVLAHEITHLKNRDVLTITLLSVIPMLLYRLAFSMFFSGRRSNSERSSNTQLIGIAAFVLYFITNLLVLYASRIREYFADKGAVELAGSPASLASALYKLVYGASRIDREDLRQVEGMKAFFASDPSQAQNEIRDLAVIDRDRNGVIDQAELQSLRSKTLRLSFGDKMLEMFGTHPNMLKRIKKLSEYSTSPGAAPR